MSTSIGLSVLSEPECLHLLAVGDVGRVILSIDALPVALPVNYRLVDNAIAFRTAAGTKLTAAANGTVVGFEVDEFDRATRSGWSVLAIGTSRVVTEPAQIAELDDADIDDWMTGALPHYVTIDILQLSGRRLANTTS